jgi:hypothetical protein
LLNRGEVGIQIDEQPVEMRALGRGLMLSNFSM